MSRKSSAQSDSSSTQPRRHPVIRVISSTASNIFRSRDEDEEQARYSSSDSEASDPRLRRPQRRPTGKGPPVRQRQFGLNYHDSMYQHSLERQRFRQLREKEQKERQLQLQRKAAEASMGPPPPPGRHLELPNDRPRVKKTLPRSSPRLSPRLMAEHMKRKLSEAILLKPENVSIPSDQMVSVNFRKLESFILEDNLSGLYSFLGSRPGVVDDRDENGTTALMVAASCNRPDFCSALIEYGADVNAEDNLSPKGPTADCPSPRIWNRSFASPKFILAFTRVHWKTVVISRIYRSPSQCRKSQMLEGWMGRRVDG